MTNVFEREFIRIVNEENEGTLTNDAARLEAAQLMYDQYPTLAARLRERAQQHTRPSAAERYRRERPQPGYYTRKIRQDWSNSDPFEKSTR